MTATINNGKCNSLLEQCDIFAHDYDSCNYDYGGKCYTGSLLISILNVHADSFLIKGERIVPTGVNFDNFIFVLKEKIHNEWRKFCVPYSDSFHQSHKWLKN